jgi:hypothetical protein
VFTKGGQGRKGFYISRCVCVRFHDGARRPFAERVPPHSRPPRVLPPGPHSKGPTKGLFLYTSRSVDACMSVVCSDVAPTGAHLLRPEGILITDIDIFWVYGFMLLLDTRT